MMKYEISNGSLSLKQRIDILKNFFVSSNLEIFEINNFSDEFLTFVTTLEGKKVSLNFLLKNVVNSGWANKPEIKRIQVKAISQENIPINTSNSCSLFAGIAFVNNEAVLAVWNPFMYVFHKTNRSCYVRVESLAIASRDGFLKTEDCKQEVLICDSKHFDSLLNVYLERNSIE